jgi:GFO/IDH/MocA oxidoreductase family protein
MNPPFIPSRRELLLSAGAIALTGSVAPAADPPSKVFRIGVISATIRGKSQARNGHTWHFAHYLHPTINLDAIKKYHHPGFEVHFARQREPRNNFNVLPFPDTKITHYYDKDATEAKQYAEAFPGVEPVTSVEKMIPEVDAVWMGDASGYGEDHFDLVAPGLQKGLPTFCDKPIGGTVAGTRKILEFARQHKAPLMSSSLFRHEWGMEAALRMRDSGEFGPLQYVIASMHGGWHLPSWFIYGQHPVWTVMTLCGPGVEAVNLYARPSGAHALVTYPDKMPAEVWYGRPDDGVQYCHTGVYFTKKRYEFTPAIEGDFGYGHHYEMFRMAATFREMVKTRQEPIPHQEILEVTAIIHAGAKSLQEKSRLVPLAEVLG